MSDISIPENFQSIESLNTLLEIYFANTKESTDIINNPLDILSTDFLIKKAGETLNPNYDVIKKELFKIHLEEIFKTFSLVETNKEIYDHFKIMYEALGITRDLKLSASIDEKINEEYIDASKSFKSKKGTKAGFFFVYDIINKVGIQNINSEKAFELIEGTVQNPNEPYQYTVKTSLYKEVVKETIIPLAHPLGFEWHFLRILTLLLEDYFGLEQTTIIKNMTLVCYAGKNNTIIEITPENFGQVRNFETVTDQDQNEKIIIDFEPLNPYPGILREDQFGLRLVRDYNGLITLYQRQQKEIVEEAPYNGDIKYLEVSNVRLLHDYAGKLTVVKEIRDTEQNKEIVKEILFKEYTIFDKDFVELEYQISGDLPDKWYYTKIPLENKTVSEDKKIFEAKIFTKTEIFKYSPDYDGEVVTNYGLCKFTYDTETTLKVLTTDISSYVTQVRASASHLPLNSLDPIYQANPDGTPYTGKYNDLDNTVEEYDTKSTFEYWARLAPGADAKVLGFDEREIGGFVLTEDTALNIMDVGINYFKSPDALYGNTPADVDYQGVPLVLEGDLDARVKRNEVYFRPTAYRNLQTLEEGSYQGEIKLYEVSSTPEIYERQNIGNEIYYAHDLETADISFSLFKNELAIDPVYSRTEHFIDSNGVDRGEFLGYYTIGGIDTETGLEKRVIGDYVVGNNSDASCPSIERYIYTFNTLVDADPVNLLYKTNDCAYTKTSKTIKDTVVNGTQFLNEGTNETEDVFAQELALTKTSITPITEDYNFRNTESALGANLIIGGSMSGDTTPTENNTFYVKGELKEIKDNNSTILKISSGKFSYKEYVTAPPLVIGEGTITNEKYIKAKIVEHINVSTESYSEIGLFDIFSDEDNWDFGVYRKVDGVYELLEDNNVSAIA